MNKKILKNVFFSKGDTTGKIEEIISLLLWRLLDQIYFSSFILTCVLKLNSSTFILTMFSGSTEHPNFKFFLMYAGAFFALGNAITALGSIFPYISAETQITETAYSFLFVCRAVGFTTGALCVKFLEKYFTYHQFLGFGTGASGVFLLIFAMARNMNIQGICIFFYAVGSGYIIVFVNVSVIECFRG